MPDTDKNILRVVEDPEDHNQNKMMVIGFNILFGVCFIGYSILNYYLSRGAGPIKSDQLTMLITIATVGLIWLAMALGIYLQFKIVATINKIFAVANYLLLIGWLLSICVRNYSVNLLSFTLAVIGLVGLGFPTLGIILPILKFNMIENILEEEGEIIDE